MINIAKGRYWDLPWSLVSGCTPCSPGCDHCWSAGISHHYRRDKIDGLPIYTDMGNGKFTGKVDVHPDRLSIPLKRRKPTVYAIWNDWAHSEVPSWFQQKMVLTAIKSEQHTILALTKRPENAVNFFNWYGNGPSTNWWSGLTVCNQAEADAKIPVFLQVPGKKFLSIEPMLGPIDLRAHILRGDCAEMCPEGNDCSECNPGFANQFRQRSIDAVILGGETGPGARPMHPDWVRSIRDQCASAGVDFFFKGWGNAVPDIDREYRANLKDAFWMMPDGRIGQGQPQPEGCTWMSRSDKKRAGRLLGGRTHDDLPWRKAGEDGDGR